MHTGNRITYRHRIPCVPVISGPYRNEIRSLRSSFGVMILYCHLHCHFHGHGSAVRIEYMVKAFRKYLQKNLAELYSRIVCQPSEHNMGHSFKLHLHGIVQNRMVISVQSTPPGGHSLYKFCTVSQSYPAAGSLPDLICRQRICRGCIRMPEMFPVKAVSHKIKIHIRPL